jgi:hypothetical protein
MYDDDESSVHFSGYTPRAKGVGSGFAAIGVLRQTVEKDWILLGNTKPTVGSEEIKSRRP